MANMEKKAAAEQMAAEMKEHLLSVIIPFWRSLRDDIYGGYYGFVGYDRKVQKDAPKGCILNSRILWFFSSVYLCYRQNLIMEADFEKYGYSSEAIRDEARHAYDFLYHHCIDWENGGIYWSLKADGTPDETTKHTYNQAFCVYALSAYYEAFGEKEALKLAGEIQELIETKCRDEIGYLEARTITFAPESNEHLSENGVMADKTMNTMLHVFEAYSQFLQVSKNENTAKRLKWICDILKEKIFNSERKRLEVFFDDRYQSILDLHSYGHDMETSWLVDWGLDVLGDRNYQEKIHPITKILRDNIFEIAFDGHSQANECDRGVVNEHRIWWVQAESVLGLWHGYEVAAKEGNEEQADAFFDATLAQWDFNKNYLWDRRAGSEWFWEVDPSGNPYPDRPIVEPWKCPYHNGRMCMEIMRRVATQFGE